MADFYREMQSMVSELIGEFQQGTMSYHLKLPGSGPDYDPGPGSTAKIPVNGVASGVAQEYIDGTLIRATDLQVLIPALPGGYELTYEYEEGGQTETRTITIEPGGQFNWFKDYFIPYNAPGSVTGVDTEGVMMIDNKEHQIIQVDQIPAAGLPVAWRVFVRA